jgi:hypothetical protein
MWAGESQPAFHRNISPLSSLKDKPNKNQQEAAASFFSYLFLGLSSDPENEGDMFL